MSRDLIECYCPHCGAREVAGRFRQTSPFCTFLGHPPTAMSLTSVPSDSQPTPFADRLEVVDMLAESTEGEG